MPTATAPAAGAAPGTRNARKTFWQRAARHRNVHSTDTFTIGQTIYRPLRRSGYLVGLKINVNGQIGVTTGTQDDPDAITNILPFIGIKSPQGTYLISVTSRALFAFGYRLFAGTSPAGDPSYAPINAASTATQTINYNFLLPISLGPGLNVETGMLMRQIANNDFMLEMRCANSADLAGGGTLAIAAAGTGLTVTVEELWYEAVDPSKVVAPPFNTFVRLREQLALSPLVSGQGNIINYPVGPVLLDALVRVVENKVAAHANVQSIELQSNYNNQIEQRNADQIRLDNYLHFGKAFPNGTFLLDFVDDTSAVNESRMRDWINSIAAAELDFTVSTKQAFNAASSSVDMTYRELVPLAVQ